MSDPDQTILTRRSTADVPGAPQQPQASKRDPRKIIAGIGCVLLICAGVLIAVGYYVGRNQFDNILARISGQEATATSSPTAPPTATPIPTSTPEPTEEADSLAEEDPAATEEATSPAVLAEPEIGAITFALGASEDYEPIDPGTLFEGEVTEIHAIFEYSGLSPDYTWERVWYLDGSEMLRSAEPWSGAEAGVFDYFINAGGAPLAVGEWVLDLFVEGELMTTGSFVIVGEEPAEVPQTPTLVQETDEAAEHSADLGPTAAPIPTSTSTPAAGTFKLAFTKWDGGKHDLFIGDTDGSSEQFILTRAAGPSWSPGGEYIYFYGEEAVDRQVISGVEYVFDGVSNGMVRINMSPIPGSIGDVRLYQGPGWNEGSARWASVSPDGQMVAYDARPGGNYRIYFLGTDENQQYRFEIDGEQGDWSPDSAKLAYRSGRGGQTGIWISNRDDSGHVALTNANDSFPAWSADGNTIAFAREEDGNVDIYTINVDGTDLQRLTDTPGPDTLPIYTPGGEIIFRSTRTGGWGIWKMSGDGANQIELYANAGVGPDWAFSKMSVLR